MIIIIPVSVMIKRMYRRGLSLTELSIQKALILDFDGSVELPVVAQKIDLRRYEECIRYCAGFGDLEALWSAIKQDVSKARINFIGSGDFHHISYLLIKNMPYNGLRVVVFDNHPDNMYFPYGIHCGSWVYHASRLPNVKSIDILGIASGDVKGINLIQNRYSSLRSGKVHYYCMSPVSWLSALLNKGQIKALAGGSLDSFVEYLQSGDDPVYVSLDKDVLMRDFLQTTWDQGVMTESVLLQSLESIKKSIVGADICGDISFYRYKSPLKRILRSLDGRPYNVADTRVERQKHMSFNMDIISLLCGS